MKFVTKIGTAFLLMALMAGFMPSASAQPVRASGCYLAQFIADVTVPDGTTYAPSTAFLKTWRLKNIGTCAWTSTDVSLIFYSGEAMGAPASMALPTTVNPGQTVDISVNMVAPSAAGHYFGYYKFKSLTGGVFGIGSAGDKSWWVEIYVSSTSGTGYDFITNASSAVWTSGAGSLTYPGTDGNTNGYVLKKDTPKFESGIVSANPGLLFAPNRVYNGFIQGSYPAFRVASGDRFQATIGCEYGATSCYVEYRLDYQIGTNAVKTFWTFREKYEGWTYNVNLDLSSLAGQDVKFILVQSAYGDATGDRALWVNPIISRASTSITPTRTPSSTVTGTPPTATSTPPATPVPAACDRAQFISDVTVPDGTYFSPNVSFSKTWRLKNVGTCTWSNYSLIFDSGTKMGGPDSAVIPTSVAPGQTVDITIQLTSPSTAGNYRGYWKLRNSSGVPFGIGSGGTKSFWVEINVFGSVTATPVTPGTPVTPATPLSGTRYDFVSNVCAATWYSGAGQLPCPGTEGDSKGFVLISSPSKLENGTTDTRTGLITFPQNVDNGYIQGIYPAYHVEAGDKFVTTVNCERGSTSCYVVFRLDYSLAGSSTIQTFWAFVERYEGYVYNAEIDLSSLAGQNVKFILTILATGSPSGDRALWVAPIIRNTSGTDATLTPTPTVPLTTTNTATATSTSTPTVTATSSSTPTPTATSTSTSTATPTATATATP